MKKLRIIFVLSVFLVFLAFNPSLAMTYEESVGFAELNFQSNANIVPKYSPDIGSISDSDNITRTNSEGTSQVLMSSWSKAAYNTTTVAGGKYQNTGYDMWLSPTQQLSTVLSLKNLTGGSAVHDAIAKIQGINTTATNDIILEHWITNDNNNLQRATLNPAINVLPVSGTIDEAKAATINILDTSGYAGSTWQEFIDAANVPATYATMKTKLADRIDANMAAASVTSWTRAQSESYADFLVDHIKGSYTAVPANGYPWSGLGYTYDWAASANALDPISWASSIRGTAEYVQLKGANWFQEGAIYSQQSYIYRVKSPVAGDSSTWCNGDFKVTSDLDSLWTGRKFQPNGNSIEVTSTGDIKDGQGILVSSLGYTLNNVGSITMTDNTKKKFSITGSENIVVLFQGDSSDAASQTNTVINSGTIGSSAITTAIQSTGKTSISNSGTIIGNLKFINGDATINATAGTIEGNVATETNSTINLNTVTITGGSAANSATTNGNLNINASEVTVAGTTSVNSGILNIDSDTANFNGTVGVIGANSRLISTGITTFTGAVTVSGGTLSLYGNTSMLSLSAGSTLDMQNGAINTVTSGATTLTDDVNLYIDATGNSSDIFKTTGALTTNGHSFDLRGINLLSAPQNSSFTLSNVVQAGSVAGTLLIDTTQFPSINTPIGTYALSSTGGSILGSLSSFNPQVFRGQVATEAAYANQLTTNNILFDHIGLITQQLLAEEKPNVYANENPLFAPYQYNKKDGGLWYKGYGNIERLQLSQGIDTQNNMWGSLVGGDFPLVKLKNGWSLLPTAYIGYTGAYQTFNGVNMYQNGGQGGIMGTFYKENFISSLLANVGGYGNNMTVNGTTDTTGNWFAGVASKSAYNIALPKDFILQPTMLLSYNAFGPQNWDTNYGSMSMTTNMLNGLNLAPGMNLILNKSSWSVYITTQLMFNIMNGVSGTAGNVDLPTIKMGSTYFQYGIGFTKRLKDRFSFYGQILFSNGVRTGVGFQGGLQWKL